jgi:hypothetical protein
VKHTRRSQTRHGNHGSALHRIKGTLSLLRQDCRHGWRREELLACGTECDMNTLGIPFNSITTELSLIVDTAITHQDPNCKSYTRQALRGLILYRFQIMFQGLNMCLLSYSHNLPDYMFWLCYYDYSSDQLCVIFSH